MDENSGYLLIKEIGKDASTGPLPGHILRHDNKGAIFSEKYKMVEKGQKRQNNG